MHMRQYFVILVTSNLKSSVHRFFSFLHAAMFYCAKRNWHIRYKNKMAAQHASLSLQGLLLQEIEVLLVQVLAPS